MVNRIEWDRIMPQPQGEDAESCRAKQIEHLLKVALGVSEDANGAWAAIWAEMKHLVTPGGVVVPEAKLGFVPACGWPAFFEKLWVLKHYLDCVQRICAERP